MKISRLALAAYGFALLVIVLDQLTKAWIIGGVSLREVGQIPVLPPILNFSWVENTGVSFGLFGGGEARWGLTIFWATSSIACGSAMWSTSSTFPARASSRGSSTSPTAPSPWASCC